MNESTIRRVIASLAFTLAIFLVSGMGAGVAFAQLGGPPQQGAPGCDGVNPQLTIKNQTTCTIQAMIFTDDPATYINERIAAGGQVVINPAPNAVNGVHDSGGFPNWFRPDAVNPNVYWVRHITVLPDYCCVDVKYEPSICTITFLPCEPLPPPPPLEL